jgi:hypothetical protein
MHSPKAHVVPGANVPGREKHVKVLEGCASNVLGAFGSNVLGVKSPSRCSKAAPPTCWP